MLSKKLKGFIGVFLCVLMNVTWAWNALGHRLVAQIAIDQLSKKKLWQLNQLNHAMDRAYPPMSLVNAAIWPDLLRNYDVTWFDAYHYIDIPFTKDQSTLPVVSGENGVNAIMKALKSLKSTRTTAYDKGLSLRLLMHVVGDLHQPMHAVTRISYQHPQGDMGGNLYYLATNPVSKELHGYWDKGAGFLTPDYPVNSVKLQRLAKRIHAQWPCDVHLIASEPSVWAEESHTIAVINAYSIEEGTYPDKRYQHSVERISQQRIALAGCRLAYLLDSIPLPSIQK